MSRGRSVLLAVLLSAVLPGPPLARAADRGPALLVEATPSKPRQGQIVTLVVRSDRPLSKLVLRHGDRAVPLEAVEGGKLFRGLVGIDLAAAVGSHRLRLEAVDADGGTHPVVYTMPVASGEFRVRRLRVARKYVDLPRKVLERVRADQAQVAHARATGDPGRRWSGPFRVPVDASPVDNFGDRRILNGKPRSPHGGVDFPAPEGAPVVAAAAGRVALADDLYFSGWTVILDHGAGLFTQYLHLSRIEVAVGDLVEAGQLIGAVGSTGRSTGPHLHWGARLHGARVNPLELLTLPEWPLMTAMP